MYYFLSYLILFRLKNLIILLLFFYLFPFLFFHKNSLYFGSFFSRMYGINFLVMFIYLLWYFKLFVFPLIKFY